MKSWMLGYFKFLSFTAMVAKFCKKAWGSNNLLSVKSSKRVKQKGIFNITLLQLK